MNATPGPCSAQVFTTVHSTLHVRSLPWSLHPGHSTHRRTAYPDTHLHPPTSYTETHPLPFHRLICKSRKRDIISSLAWQAFVPFPTSSILPSLPFCFSILSAPKRPISFATFSVLDVGVSFRVTNTYRQLRVSSSLLSIPSLVSFLSERTLAASYTHPPGTW